MAHINDKNLALTLTLEVIQEFRSAVENSSFIKIDETIEKIAKKHQIDKKTQRIVYARSMDVIKRWKWANSCTNKLLNRKCPTRVQNLLAIGAVEVCYKIRKTQTTINQICNYAKKWHNKYATLAYAVLKNLERSDFQEDSHCPQWIQDLIKTTINQKNQILAAWLTPPVLFIRIHPWKTNIKEFTAMLENYKIEFKRFDLGWQIAGNITVPNIPGYEEGLFYVQDANAAHIDYWFSKIQGQLWDACSAPGGKTLAALAFNNIRVSASDNSLKRLKILQQNIQRANPPYHIEITTKDARTKHNKRDWDAILLDVPCSGSGVFGKHPERKWLLKPQELTALIATQKEILENAWMHLKTGGELLYMTCSVFNCENEEQISNFLENNHNAKLLEPSKTLLPGPYGGFYFARLGKIQV